MPASGIWQWNRRWMGLAVFVLALLIRVLYLLDIRDTPFFEAPVIDAEYYNSLAVALSQGEGTGRAPFMMPPLFPLLLSLLYRIAGPDIVLAHVLQILLGAGSAGLACVLGCRVAGALVGLVAGFVVATSKALLYVGGDLLATPLAVFLDLVFLVLLIRCVHDGVQHRALALAGFAAGLAALARPSILAFVAVLLGWLAWRRRWAAAGILLVASVLPTLPVTVHNLRASGEPVWISANGGINFYMGNNPEMRRTAALRPGPEWRRMNDLPLRESGIVHAAGRDRWFYAEGVRFWRAHPAQALAQTFEKAVLLVHDHEIMRDFDFYYFREHYSKLLRLPGWNFAVLLALALVGLTRARRGTVTERVLLLFLVAYAVGIVLFFVSARYRAPLIPVLGVFAGLGVSWLWEQWRLGAWKELAVASGLIAAALVVSVVDWYDVDHVDEVEARYRVGTALQSKGEHTSALRAFDGVLQLDADHALAAARAALSEQQLGRPDAAVERYELLLERHPEFVEPMVNLANLAWRFERPDTAERYFRRAIATDPWFAQAYGHYGLFLLAEGEPLRAVTNLRRALAYDPVWEALRVDLARALLLCGDAAAAWNELRRAVEILPASDAVELVRGDVLHRLGRDVEARAAWQNGLRLNPANDELRQRLAPSTGGRRPRGS